MCGWGGVGVVWGSSSFLFRFLFLFLRSLQMTTATSCGVGLCSLKIILQRELVALRNRWMGVTTSVHCAAIRRPRLCQTHPSSHTTQWANRNRKPGSGKTPILDCGNLEVSYIFACLSLSLSLLHSLVLFLSSNF